MYVAIDIGATKTLLATFDAKGKLLQSVKFATDYWYPTFVEDVIRAYATLEGTSEAQYCVIGAPGKVDRKHGVVVAFGNLPWENVNLRKDFGKVITCPILIENDAKLAALSEANLIKHGYKKALYLTISTGINGGFVKDGILDEDNIDMEVGHMIFEHDGKLQQWEEFASGSALTAKYGKLASELEDPNAWHVIARNIALGLNHLLTVLSPDVIIFGGGVGAHFEKFEDQLHEELMLYGASVTSVPPLRKAIRAEEAVIYGCYELARQQK
jgi:predicted NBD/HSP70 family sugar kinase